jgi:hypothetical protein
MDSYKFIALTGAIMKTIKLFIFSAILFSSQLVLAASQAHLLYIIKAWPQAPKSMSLIDTALKEAKIADLYIQIAQSQDQDLAWIKLHINRAKHALEGTKFGDGGLGYGVIKSSSQIAKQMNSAAKASDASVNIKLHTEKIVSAAEHTAAIAKRMLAICHSIARSISTSQAIAYVTQLKVLSNALMEGEDINKDGIISHFDNESALRFTSQQLNFAAQAEGLIKVKK